MLTHSSFASIVLDSITALFFDKVKPSRQHACVVMPRFVRGLFLGTSFIRASLASIQFVIESVKFVTCDSTPRLIQSLAHEVSKSGSARLHLYRFIHSGFENFERYLII